MDSLAIVCIAKNEGKYIKEWIEYHKLVGINRIYLYDNDSTDDMKDILKPYIDKNFVKYHTIHGKKKQCSAYNKALFHYRFKAKYLAFIDCDEFLVPTENRDNVYEIVENTIRNKCSIGGVVVNWCMYGSSGLKRRPKGLVIENFLYRAKLDGRGNPCVKSIVNPRKVLFFHHVHYPIYFPGFYAVNEFGEKTQGWSNEHYDWSHLRCNHYFTKSEEEWIERRSLGKADCKGKRPMEEFYQHDNNEVYDDIMLKYADSIKMRM